ncbi:Putative FAD binding domain dehydrogenase [Podospora comata]|uniref:FAD binding domain dehydrogenase n=1 Tax=Podospora comata TaxID=48703 RepID=A0ABY6SIJ1_PODCO|nr:Putative FAD binding domain dehydrogenase [Podospora comata]
MSLIKILGVLLTFNFSVQATRLSHPLFAWETTPLDPIDLARLVQDTNTSQYEHLFPFTGQKTPATPNRLSPGTCKVFPGDNDWPSPEAWDAFGKVLGGALIKTVPAAAVCYANTGLYDAQRCSQVQANFSNPYFHEDDPTSNFFPNFQGRTCLPTSDPRSSNCTHGAFPVYAVNATNVQQIQLAINFARNTNIRLVIKNTGHCYLGKSTGAGALIDGFEQGGKALKIAPGATVRQVYEAADRNGVSVLGGICESVGYAGGYVAGGGHTPLSGLYGMAADHVLALQLVTAEGQFTTVSPKHNPDLYWALRGGGAGTFGVVTSVIIRAQPKLPVVTSTFSISTSDTVSAEIFWKGMRGYFELFIPFTDAGTYSWWVLVNTSGNYVFSMSPFFAPNHTIESFNKLDVMLNAAGGMNIAGNWLLPRRNWENRTKFEETFAVIKRHSESGRMLMGYHQAPRNRANVDNAVNNAWRETVCFLILAAVIDAEPLAFTPGLIGAASREFRDEILAPFRAVAPESDGGGAYLNEAHVDDPNWREAFYGGHYERLSSIKQKWDPGHVFYATTAVGSERWEVRDGDQGIQTQNGRLCRT